MKRPRRFDPSKHETAPNPIGSLSDAALTGWCWRLAREPDGRWTLRHWDWLTEAVSEPVHTSPEPMEHYIEAMEWAKGHGVNLIQWEANEDGTIQVDSMFYWLRMVARRATPSVAA